MGGGQYSFYGGIQFCIEPYSYSKNGSYRRGNRGGREHRHN